MLLTLGLVLFLLESAVCPPPLRQQAQAAQAADTQHETQGTQKGQQQEQHQQGTPDDRKPMYEFTYSKYLEEVVKILESDPKFNERLRGMNENEIKDGNIADHIEDLDQGIFDRLHKAKFDEIERLREQIAKQIEVDGGPQNIKMPEHLDVQNIEKFHKEDLRKLILKTVADMNEIDSQRKDQFKQYEMQKKAEEDHKLAQLSEQERIRALHEAEERKKRHNEHEKLKHPGSRDQLEQVWEDSDHLEKDAFNPRTFFALHDLNGDGYWNDVELEALFQLELQKMYNDTNPDDDPRERMEEMYRMREHVSKQIDKNGDRLISLEEFLQDTEAQTPEKDEGWQDLGQKDVFTEAELAAYEQEYAKQQGWGEDAYKAVTVQPVLRSEQHPQPVHQQVPPVVPVHPQTVQHPAQPEGTVPVQQVHQQPIQQHPPQAAVSVQPHAPIADLPKDPSYGI